MSQTKWVVAADDLTVITRGFEKRLEATSNPRQRKMLETLIEHLRTEGSGDLDGVMNTVSPNAEFLQPDGSRSKGHDEIRSHYRELFTRGGIGNITVTNQRIVVDDDAIVNEVTIVRFMPWHLAQESGYAINEELGHYMVWRRMCSVIPFDDQARLSGEIHYLASLNPTDCERVPDALLTPGYLRWFDALLPL